MPKNNITSNHFNYSYQADCTTCGKYVGPKRELQSEAESDSQAHKNIPKNKDHEVEIEETQST